MLRRTIAIVLLLWVGETFAFTTDQYGEWNLEKLNGNVLALSTKDMRPMGDRILFAHLSFLCDHRYKKGEISASLIPFDGTYNNQQNDVPVLVQKSPDNITPSDLSQKWSNGFKYIFVHDQNEIEELITYLKTNERNGVETVHFFFSGQFSGQTDVLNHVKINLSGFNEGISMLQVSCKP